MLAIQTLAWRRLNTILIFFLSISFAVVKAQSGIITTVAGDAGIGYNGDNQQATVADLNLDGGVTVDDAGNIYIADSQNNRIRKVNTSGIITTIAGNGFAGFSGDGGLATAAECSFPICVRVDTLGNVYFSDANNNVVRKINSAGHISTIAGNYANGPGYSGNGGLATAAEINYPVGISVDKNLNVFIADQNNNVIREVTYATGRISTVAGQGPPALAGYSGNTGPATKAQLDSATGVAVDRAGNIYIADYKNSVVRVVNTSGIINAFAGNGTNGFTYFAGRPDTLELSNPVGVSTDAAGNVYIADAGNAVVWEELKAKDQMYVIAGIVDASFSGDGGPAFDAEINYPFDMMPDKSNNVFIADLGNNRVRKITAGCAGNNATADIYNYPECYGNTDGKMVGNTNSNFEPYSYLWSPGGATSDTISNLSAGTYTLYVTDAFNCVGSTTVALTQPPAIIVKTSNYSVCVNSDVTLVSGASGGTGPFTFEWINGAPYDTTTIVAANDEAYTVYVTDSTGCNDSAVANVTVNPLPAVNLNAEIYNVCSYATVDTLYGLPPGGTYSGPDLTGNVFDPKAAGAGIFTFSYTYTDSNGCSNTAMQNINVNICAGIQGLTNDERIAAYPNPATDGFTLQLQNGDMAQMINIFNITGQTVYENHFPAVNNSQLTPINTQNYPCGVYFLKVVLQDGTTLVNKIDVMK